LRIDWKIAKTAYLRIYCYFDFKLAKLSNQKSLGTKSASQTQSKLQLRIEIGALPPIGKATNHPKVYQALTAS